MNGSDVLLLVNTGTNLSPEYEVVASQRGVTFERNNAEIDFSSKTGGREMIVEAGRYDATVTLDGLYVPTDEAYQALDAACEAGTLIKIRRQEEGTATREADALITQMSEAFPDQDAATISVSLRISGPWSEVGS